MTAYVYCTNTTRYNSVYTDTHRNMSIGLLSICCLCVRARPLLLMFVLLFDALHTLSQSVPVVYLISFHYYYTLVWTTITFSARSYLRFSLFFAKFTISTWITLHSRQFHFSAKPPSRVLLPILVDQKFHKKLTDFEARVCDLCTEIEFNPTH